MTKHQKAQHAADLERRAKWPERLMLILVVAFVAVVLLQPAHAGRRDGGCCYPVPRGTAQ